MSWSPALAVDREMVGSDRDGRLIDGEGLSRRYCCWAWAALSRAACAVCCSLLLGCPEKNCVKRVALVKEFLLGVGFSAAAGTVTVDVAVLAKGFFKT